ncbi:hypothetical protein ACS0TY_028261 [Phlomoides rotata]
MKQIFIWACLLSILHPAKSDEQHVRDSLLEFLSKLSNANTMPDSNSGWNPSSYPCKDNWKGITCDQQSNVQKIELDSSNFSGIFDARSLCNARSLSSSLLVIDLTNNSLNGQNLEDIHDCFQLTGLFIGSNEFSGNLPESISKLKNLQILDISHNQMSGPFPDLSGMSGLTVFRAQENQFSGHIPNLDFSGLSELNVSSNNLTGPVPASARRFDATSFVHNPYMCGPPLPNECTSIHLASDPPQTKHEKHGFLDNQVLMYSGYVLIGLLLISSIILACFYKRGKKRGLSATTKVADSTMSKFSTVELKGSETEVSKTDYSSAVSAESGIVSSSLIVLADGNGLRFDDLLKAPAELVGRGSHGSVYKVEADQGRTLAVKRIKDWTISSSLFRQRMRRLNQVKHPNVLPVIAYYSTKQEKLLVYEYQQNGSLFRLIHTPPGNQNRQRLDWSSRLSYAGTIADALAYMHEELQYDRIPHGNLKSSNILMNNNMDPCISEYGATLAQNDQEQSSILANSDLEAAQDDYKSIFKTDTYAFGVILLELLTGRTVLAEGLDLATWVVAVVREEWTVEVFDKNLVRDGVNEGAMISALQLAIKCVSESSERRPSMKEVAMGIKGIREDDKRYRSMDVSHDMSMSRSFIDI